MLGARIAAEIGRIERGGEEMNERVRGVGERGVESGEVCVRGKGIEWRVCARRELGVRLY